MAEKEKENNCEAPLFVEAVTTEVQIQNDECYFFLMWLYQFRDISCD